MKCVKAFTNEYCCAPTGTHSDMQLGKITGLAMNKGVYFTHGSSHDGNIELSSFQFRSICDSM